MRAQRRGLHPGISLLFITLAAPCYAAESAGVGASSTPDPPPRPIVFLRAHDKAVKAILDVSDTLSAAHRDKVKEQINTIFDFEELSRLTLGDHWNERTPEERRHFVGIYRGIVEEQNFDTFEKHYREGKITYVGEEVAGDKAVVNATLPLEKESVPIAYLMHRTTADWKVYDLVIDGTSTAAVNRKSYSRRIAKRSYEWLVERPEKQLAKIQGN